MLQSQLENLALNTFECSKAPTRVCWNLTSRCNLGCRFCFGPQNVENELSTAEIKVVLDKLKKAGVERVVLSGGEPLLKDDILQIIKEADAQGLKVSLATNGLLLTQEFLSKVKKHLALIEITVDGADNSMEEKMRGESQIFERVIKNLELIKRSGVPLKINTMVCRKNIDALEEIGEIAKKFGVQCWKIFQFVPRNRGQLYKAEFDITDKEFEQLRLKISARFPNLNLIWADKDFFKGSYFNIYPDGSVTIPGLENDTTIGNILAQSIEELWGNSIIDKKKHTLQAKVPYES